MLLIGLFRTGGLAELLERLLGPLAEAVGFPREALTVLLLRPLLSLIHISEPTRP